MAAPAESITGYNRFFESRQAMDVRRINHYYRSHAVAAIHQVDQT